VFAVMFYIVVVPVTIFAVTVTIIVSIFNIDRGRRFWSRYVEDSNVSIFTQTGYIFEVIVGTLTLTAIYFIISIIF